MTDSKTDNLVRLNRPWHSEVSRRSLLKAAVGRVLATPGVKPLIGIGTAVSTVVGVGAAVLENNKQAAERNIENFKQRTNLNPQGFSEDQIARMSRIFARIPEALYNKEPNSPQAIVRVHDLNKTFFAFNNDSAYIPKADQIEIRGSILERGDYAGQYEVTRALVLKQMQEMNRFVLQEFLSLARQTLLVGKQDMRTFINNTSTNNTLLTWRINDMKEAADAKSNPVLEYYPPIIDDIALGTGKLDGPAFERFVCIIGGVYGLGRDNFEKFMSNYYGEDKDRVQSLYNLFKAKLFYDQDVKPQHEVGK